MKFWFSFLLILLSCVVIAEEDSASGASAPEEAEQVESDQKDNNTQKQGEKDASQGDFKPSQEISEDYPVPLPADI